MITEKTFETREELFEVLKQDTVEGLGQAVQKKGKASMLLSGGTSPGEYYKALSHEDLPWSDIYFSLSDERWVAPDHADSNELLVHNTLLQNKAAAANFVGLKSAADTVGAGRPLTNKALEALPRPFDIVLLGMGTDGHTASLFPDSMDTAAALDMENTSATWPIRRGDAQVPRLSMSLKSLLNTDEIKLLFFGEEKWAIYEEAIGLESMDRPVSFILNQARVAVTVYWAP